MADSVSGSSMGAFTLPSLPTTILTVICIFVIAKATYNLTLHPLAHLPGPKLCAITRFPYWYRVFTGRDAHWIHELHETYKSDVIRFGPSDASFTSPQAWRDTQGHVKKGQLLPDKAPDYGMQAANGVPSVIMCAGDRHARMRKIFAPAFSERALRKQEPVFKKYVRLLLTRLDETFDATSAMPTTATIEMTRYLNFVTFDIMSELCFGRPLDLLSKNEFSPWVASIFEMIQLLPASNFIQYYPLLNWLLKKFEPKWLRDTKSDHFRHSADRVDQRLKEGVVTEGTDLWSFVVRENEELAAVDEGKGVGVVGGLTLDEMHSNAELFMLAGTETTATLLAGLLFYLCTDIAKLRLLTDEIRSTHRSGFEGMTFDSLARLPYLKACIKEGLRIYPPVPAGGPRVIGAGGLEVAGHYVSEGMRVLAPHYATHLSSMNWAAADEFLPERWLPASHALRGGDKGDDERFAKDQWDAWQPFGHGGHACIGQGMAMHEARLILAGLLCRFDFELDAGGGMDRWIQQKAKALWVKTPLRCRVRRAAG